MKAERSSALLADLEVHGATEVRGESDCGVLAERLTDRLPCRGLRVLDKTPFDPKPGRPKGSNVLARDGLSNNQGSYEGWKLGVL